MAKNASALGDLFRKEISQLGSRHIELVRGKGLLNAVVIRHPDKDAAWNLCLRLMENGLLAKPTHGDKIRFAPPLVITAAQLNECIDIIHRSLSVLD